jgi:ComF family protein
MAGWMSRAGSALIATADLVTPIPLHRRRLWSRRFNQSALLAAEIARGAGKEFAPEGIARVKATRQQVGLSASERAKNVAGAFAVPDAARAAIAGRRVLLIDDVYTTGETSKAATKVLLRAGAASVDVLVFALVVRA